MFTDMLTDAAGRVCAVFVVDRVKKYHYRGRSRFASVIERFSPLCRSAVGHVCADCKMYT